jgi:hypothetical protein
VLTEAERDHTNRKITTITHAALMRRTIRVVCPCCQRYRLFDAIGLWNLAKSKGWGERLGQVAAHLYCRRCWRDRRCCIRGRLYVTDEEPEGPQFAYPAESEWKRLVSRFRT